LVQERCSHECKHAEYHLTSHLVLIHTIFAVIKACLAAAVAALIAGVSIVGTIIILAVLGGLAVAGMFGVGGSRFAARRRAKRDGAGGN